MRGVGSGRSKPSGLAPGGEAVLQGRAVVMGKEEVTAGAGEVASAAEGREEVLG